MKTSQNLRPRIASSLSSPAASTAATFWFTIVPSVSRWMNRLGAVLTSVTRKLNWERSSAWSRTFSSGEPDRRRDEIDRVRLLGERRIVDERGHPPAAALDRRHGPLRRRRRLLDVPAVGVDPAFAVAEAVDDLERRVVQRVRDRVAERDAGIEREQDPRGAGAVEAAAEHAGEERRAARARTRSGRAPRRREFVLLETWSSATETVSSATEMPQER